MEEKVERLTDIIEEPLEKIEVRTLDEILNDIDYSSTKTYIYTIPNQKLLQNNLEYLEYINEVEKEVEALDKYMRESIEITSEPSTTKEGFIKQLEGLKKSDVLLASATLLTGATISVLVMPVGVVLGAKVAIGGLGLASYAGYYYIKTRKTK